LLCHTFFGNLVYCPRNSLETRDLLAQVAPLRDRVDDWPAFMAQGLDDETRNAIRRGERTGRPLGSDAFIAALEARTGRTMARQRPGPKPAANAAR
jgi:putative transposase